MVEEHFARHFANATHEVLAVPAGERFGANCISENGTALVHEWAEEAQAILRARGLTVRTIDTSEFVKIDGAMSCLSKIFTAPVHA